MILSVSIVNSTGRTLVARQFSHLSRSQVEGRLNAFPKLITSKSQSYIETESIRYVFQDLNGLYFVLITTKDSNILEDLDLLSMLLQLSREITGELTEETIIENSLELITAYDECIFDGYRQNVTSSEVSTFLRMESKEEDEAIRIRKEKEQKAAQEMKEKLKELEKQKKNRPKQEPQQVATPASYVFVEETEPERPVRPVRQARAGMSLRKKASAREKAKQVMMDDEE